MSKIRVLPKILANKIAAGEIVERPASVVKELVENALDAGARSIEIGVESGGKRLIRVRDDGEGMTQDDAILAFEHHATSKIQTAEDLGAIATLGFRGEALPSIASISRLRLRTRARLPAGSDAAPMPGTEIEFQGGTLRSVKAVAWDRGTKVSVRDLFFNVPARRKFLRSHATESSHITRLATHYALARHDLRLKLEFESRTAIDVAPARDLDERCYQIFGAGFLDNMVAVDGRLGNVRIRGFTSHPKEQRTNTHSQFFYVNGRIVRDRVLTGAVRQAYRHTIPASAHPVVLLFLELPFDQVDVNAHPAKVEVRFRDQATVYEVVRESLVRALGTSVSLPVYEHRPAWGMGGDGPRMDEVAGALAVHAPEGVYGQAHGAVPAPGASGDPNLQGAFDYSRAEDCREGIPDRPESVAGPANGPFSAAGVRVLGQIHESYIVASDSRGLVIVDQHVAHERVLYERNARAIAERRIESQGLLVPVTLELAPHQGVLFDRAAPELERNGFSVERFGGNTVVVRSVPVIAREHDCRQLVLELLDGLGKEERSLDVERIADRVAVSLACHAAIKVNMPLTIEKMQWLIDALARTRVPTHCPHGRPILLRFDLHEIERNFRRI